MGCLYCVVRATKSGKVWDVRPACYRGHCLSCYQHVRSKIQRGELNENNLLKKGLMLPAEKVGDSWRKVW